MPEHQILKSNKGLQIYFVVVKMSKIEISTVVKLKKKTKSQWNIRHAHIGDKSQWPVVLAS